MVLARRAGRKPAPAATTARIVSAAAAEGHARSAAITSYVRLGGLDLDELLGLCHGQEAQHQLVDKGEDGCVGADREGQRCASSCAWRIGDRTVI